MLAPEDADLLLTIRDLATYVSDEVRRVGAEEKIVVDCSPEELRLTSSGFTHGLSIAIDISGRWTISTLIQLESDGDYIKAMGSFATENTLTVLRAISRWISGAMMDRPEERKTRFRLVLERMPAT